MILSHRHKFIFVKGIKVAGTSVEIALSQVCGPEDIITTITPADERFRLGSNGEPRNYASRLYPAWLRRRLEKRYVHQVTEASAEQLASVRPPRGPFRNHMPLARVLELVPQAQDYEVFCVERSPYAKVMSLANWSQHNQAYNRGQGLESSASRIAEGVDRIFANGVVRKALNIDRYRDREDKIRATPWKAPTLESDLARFFSDRGLAAVRLVHAKRGIDSDKVDPSKVLRPDQIGAINQLFSEEFSAFGWPILAP